MAPIPSPYFPEPITVEGNVADGDYRQAVKFTRKVAFAHLSLLLLIGVAIKLLSRPETLSFIATIHIETVWVAAIASLVGLSYSRTAHLAVQLPLFLIFAACFCVVLAAILPFLITEFQDVLELFAWCLGSAWAGLFLYNLVARRDYSLVGEYWLVWLFMAVSLAGFSYLRNVSFGEAFAVMVIDSGFLFYWIYDLAMVLRRRVHSELVAATLDLFRDVLNFVGYPIRVMRMQRRPRRVHA